MNDDLISRSALLEEFDWVNCATAGEGNYEEDLRLLVKRVTEMPAEDAEIIRHGRWILMAIGHDFYQYTTDYVFRCSECGLRANNKFPYCHCGCKMDAEVAAKRWRDNDEHY